MSPPDGSLQAHARGDTQGALKSSLAAHQGCPGNDTRRAAASPADAGPQPRFIAETFVNFDQLHEYGYAHKRIYRKENELVVRVECMASF